MRSGSSRTQSGFTYMGVLMFVALSGIALSVVGPVWHAESQREREKDLLFVGEQYAQAIASYYQSTPGGVKSYPQSLQDLVQDKRLPTMKRHLRKLYRDPVTGSEEWGLVRQQGRITGVYSLSKDKPLKQEGFGGVRSGFAGSSGYDQWRFVAVVNATSAGGGASLQGVAVDNAQGAMANSPISAPAGGTEIVPVAASALPAETSPRRKEAYATCQTAMAAENLQCRSGCGNLAGPACRSCFAKAFDNYRACLHGG